jgi:hypothetical protein
MQDAVLQPEEDIAGDILPDAAPTNTKPFKVGDKPTHEYHLVQGNNNSPGSGVHTAQLRWQQPVAPQYPCPRFQAGRPA